MLLIIVGALGFGAIVVAIVLAALGSPSAGLVVVLSGLALNAAAVIVSGMSRLRERAKLELSAGNAGEFDRVDHRIPGDRWGIPGSEDIMRIHVKVLRVDNLSGNEAKRVRAEIVNAQPADRATAFPVRLAWYDSGAEERDISPRSHAYLAVQTTVMTNQNSRMLGHSFLWNLDPVIFTVQVWAENASAVRKKYELAWPDVGPYRPIRDLALD